MKIENTFPHQSNRHSSIQMHTRAHTSTTYMRKNRLRLVNATVNQGQPNKIASMRPYVCYEHKNHIQSKLLRTMISIYYRTPSNGWICPFVIATHVVFRIAFALLDFLFWFHFFLLLFSSEVCSMRANRICASNTKSQTELKWLCFAWVCCYLISCLLWWPHQKYREFFPLLMSK